MTAANKQDRDQIGKLAEAAQKQTGKTVELAYVDQGYTGKRAAKATSKQKIELSVAKLPGAEHGFVLQGDSWSSEALSGPPTGQGLRKLASTL